MGTCIEGVCYCDPHHIGAGCEIASCPDSCSNRGVCVTAENAAAVEKERSPRGPVTTGAKQGDTAAAASSAPKLLQRDPLGPHNTGSPYNGPAVPYCKCDDGFAGSNCGTPVCPGAGNCSGHGRCDSDTLQCSCQEGWNGDGCALPDCPNDCSGHGECTIDGCVCNVGFTSSDCSRIACPLACSGHGVCNDGGKCECEAAWTGDGCFQPQCPRGCSGH